MMDYLIGKTIQNYLILDRIGAGGMGVVYKARHTILETLVALKMINPIYAAEKYFIEKFTDEARRQAQLQHPNIVAVKEFLITDEGNFIVMEYIEGGTLEDKIRSSSAPMDWHEAIVIFKQVLDAVGYAHSRRPMMIHRDIKPLNILLTLDGRAKVTDFGLAKIIEEGEQSGTRSLTGAGTRHYMSPEQHRGVKDIDQRTDIYALGITLYKMIAGRTPFEEQDTPATIVEKIEHNRISLPNVYNPLIPIELAKFVSRCYQHNRNKRFQSVAEMQEALEETEQNLLRPVPQNDKFLKKIAMVLAGLLLIILIVVFWGKIFDTHGPSISGLPLPDDGYITINSSPDKLEFLIDSVRVRTPVTNHKVKYGRHSVKLLEANFMPIDTVLNVDSQKPIQYTLQATPCGSLTVNSLPKGAAIVINKKDYGITPLQNHPFPVGLYIISLNMAGYLPITDTIEITQGETTERPIYFLTKEPKPPPQSGSLVIVTTPSEAKVIINGHDSGPTPFKKEGIPVGQYTVTVNKPGYKPVTESIHITQDWTEKKNYDLKPEVLSITIKPTPYADIYINGALVKRNVDFRLTCDLQPGPQKIRLENDQYGVYEKLIDVSALANPNIDIDFEKEYPITVTSVPSEAMIFIDGKAQNKSTPAINIKVHTGIHTVRVELQGVKKEEIRLVEQSSDKKFHFNF